MFRHALHLLLKPHKLNPKRLLRKRIIHNKPLRLILPRQRKRPIRHRGREMLPDNFKGVLPLRIRSLADAEEELSARNLGIESAHVHFGDVVDEDADGGGGPADGAQGVAEGGAVGAGEDFRSGGRELVFADCEGRGDVVDVEVGVLGSDVLFCSVESGDFAGAVGGEEGAEGAGDGFGARLLGEDGAAFNVHFWPLDDRYDGGCDDHSFGCGRICAGGLDDIHRSSDCGLDEDLVVSFFRRHGFQVRCRR